MKNSNGQSLDAKTVIRTLIIIAVAALLIYKIAKRPAPETTSTQSPKNTEQPT